MFCCAPRLVLTLAVIVDAFFLRHLILFQPAAALLSPLLLVRCFLITDDLRSRGLFSRLTGS